MKMFKIRLIAVGFLKNGPEYELYHKYAKRLSRPVELIEIKAGSDFMMYMRPNSYVMACDEKGENISTEALYGDLCAHPVVTFLIGGADGLPSGLPIQKKLSFGRMTWPHLLVRTLLIEQIYRCQQIKAKHPYHRGS